MLDKIRQLVRLIDDAETVFKSTAAWEIKYKLIFSLNIHELVGECGLRLDWFDPDTTYQEDVTFYVNSLLELRSELGNLCELAESGKC